MNKTAIKNFAIWARNKLIADISYRAGLMGITPDGIYPRFRSRLARRSFMISEQRSPMRLAAKSSASASIWQN